MKNIKNVLREVTADYDLNIQMDDNFYHNTLELLRLYSKVIWRIKSSLKEMDQECKELTNRRLSEIVDSLIEIDPRIKEERLTSRLQSIEHSKSIIEFIDLSMIKLKEYPENGQKYYEILLLTYIEKKNLPIEDLAEELGISRSTLFRDKKKAINMFGIILWGYIFEEIKN